MSTTLFKNAQMINEGKITSGDLLVKNGRIEKISGEINDANATIRDLNGKYLMPGMIDDQVHFREPGLTHKGHLQSESAAAAAGGITSYMEMPNTNPPATTIEELEKKFSRAAEVSKVNYSFYLGGSNTNIDEVKKMDPNIYAGLKVFMGSSTGNMLVDKVEALTALFKESPTLITTHCEDTPTIDANQREMEAKYGDDIPMNLHGIIRSAEACYKSSSLAVELAKKYDARLHILHLTTAKEMELFSDKPLSEKRITAEACVHHLFFDDSQYDEKGTHIKWNPAIKTAKDRAALRQALLDGKIDVIATDHAPHTLEEKANPYTRAPSGGPLVQHCLPALFGFAEEGWLPLEMIVQKVCHNVAELYQVKERGYLREGYHADLVVVNPKAPWTVAKENILYKCGWSPFEGHTFPASIETTLVNGITVYDQGKLVEGTFGKRLEFSRD